MTAELVPYLMFPGHAREALQLYQSVFGGDVEMMTFADQGGMGLPEADQQLVMHGALAAPGVHVFVSDTPEAMGQPHANGAMALAGAAADTTTLHRWWDALAEGGTVDVPLEQAPWGDEFGQVKDRFGIDWMFNIGGQG